MLITNGSLILNPKTRDLSWETSIYPHIQLTDLEDRLPLPFKCMVEELSTSELSQNSISRHFVIDSCYSLFLAETTLRQIVWRTATAPELQQHEYHSSGAGQSTKATASCSVIREIERQFSEWLACIPESADWTPGACTGQISPLRSRVRIQYWFGRFQLYKSSLYVILSRHDHEKAGDSQTLTWLHYAINAAFNALSVFLMEHFVPDDIFAHRYVHQESTNKYRLFWIAC